MAVTTKKTFPATTNSTTDTFGPIGIELNNQDDLDVYITESGGTRVLQYKQTSASTTDSNHPQVNDTTGLYFPPVAAGVALKNYTISADNNNVIFNSDLPSGAVVSVERRTRDSSSSYTSFSGGSTIRSTDLNTAFDETRFTAQEGRNKAFDLERQTFSEDGNIRLLEDQSLIYEGATDDAHETKLAITDPTADRTITFPDVSGNVVTTGDTGTVNATMLATDSVNSDELVADSVVTAKIANDQVTYAKIQNVSATDRILGRDSAGAGDIEEITPAALRTMLNVANGATPDQSDADIRAAVEAATDSNVFTDTDHSRLNAIEDNATRDQTGAEIKSAYEGESNTNAYTDAEKTKLAGIDTSADVTDATTVNAAGAVMNTDLATKGTIVVGDGSGDPTILSVGTNNHVLVADSNEASGVKWATVPAGSGLSNVVEDTTPQLGGDLDVNGNDIVSTSNANINIIPNGTGDVNLDADTIRVGDNNTDTTITTQGTGDLTLSTNSGTNSGTIEIEDGADNDIVITPNGTGDVVIDGLKYPQADGSAGQFLKTNGSAQLSWSTVTTDVVGDTSPQLGGNLDINGNDIVSVSNGNINITPNGTGNIKLNSSSGITELNATGHVFMYGSSTNHLAKWNYTKYQLEFWDNVKASFGSSEDFEIWHDSTDNQIKGNNGKIVISTTAGNSDIEITPNGTGDVIIDGLKYPQADGSAGQFLKTNGSAQLSWDTVVGTITALNNQTANRLTTIGSTTTELDGEASLTFEDTTSTGLISGKQITARGFECPATVSDDWTIAAGNNAFFPGPMTVAANKTVTVPANRTLTIV